MAATKEIRTKIRSIRNTQKITRAMEMVAASKMRKALERMERAKPYAKKILQVIHHVARGHLEYHHPYLQTRDIKRVGYIVVTTDRGLCGSLNNNLLKTVLRDMKRLHDNNIPFDLCLLGNKAMGFFKRVGGNIIANASYLGDAPTVTDLIGVVRVMLNAYLKDEIDALYLCSNEFINKMRLEPHLQQILPLVPGEEEQLKHHWDYIYEPDEAPVLLDSLLTRYIESQIYRGVIENIACEQAARMIAMKSATDNAADLIDELELIYHKARQATITRELSEIVAGASVI
jgi:F-type H+-transporting ATPase subunit gamma